jgi:hypothetical protein
VNLFLSYISPKKPVGFAWGVAIAGLGLGLNCLALRLAPKYLDWLNAIAGLQLAVIDSGIALAVVDGLAVWASWVGFAYLARMLTGWEKVIGGIALILILVSVFNIIAMLLRLHKKPRRAQKRRR